MEISAAEFKAKCLKLMDEVARTRKVVVITKRGRPLAQLVAIQTKSRQPMFGCMAGTVMHEHDILNPADAADWEVLTGSEPNLFPRKRGTQAGRRRG